MLRVFGMSGEEIPKCGGMMARDEACQSVRGFRTP